MDGFEATRRIRASNGPNAQTIILGLTASADAVTLAQCRESGMDEVITKPIRRKAFLAAIAAQLRRRHPRKAAASSRPPTANPL